jgi:hypothetical protein
MHTVKITPIIQNSQWHPLSVQIALHISVNTSSPQCMRTGSQSLDCLHRYSAVTQKVTSILHGDTPSLGNGEIGDFGQFGYGVW